MSRLWNAWVRRWQALALLHKALLVSVGVHGALLTVRWVDPEGFNRLFKDTPLEVILVNSASQERPEKAQALAQANLAGGGEAERGRATSPLPPSPQAETGESLDATQRMLEQMHSEQQQLLTQLKQELAALPPPQPQPSAQASDVRSQQAQRRQLTQMLAEIEKRIQEENARPKKRYLSPATLRSADALYYSHFRTEVERAGTEHFPTNAQGQKLYGDLVMETWIDRQGRVVDTVITRSSGNRQLDKRAAAIVRRAGPFGVVPEEVRAGHDLLLVSSRFRFTQDAGFQAAPQASP